MAAEVDLSQNGNAREYCRGDRISVGRRLAEDSRNDEIITRYFARALIERMNLAANCEGRI